MKLLAEFAPWFIAMGVLGLASALFSASEAALFSLSRKARWRMAGGNPAQRTAAGLLADADRLLSSVLFANLLANIAWFAISSIISLKLEREGRATEAETLAAGSLLVLIIFGELLPKSLAVLQPQRVATTVALPLAAVVRLLRRLLTVLRLVAELSRRVIWPAFQPEPYLAAGDLERALRLSTSNAALMEHEQAVLQGIVSLSTIRVDELMRPRTRIAIFRPPVALADLGGQLPSSGYLLVAEADSDEVAAAVNLRELPEIPDEHLEQLARPVVYLPWSATVAQAVEHLHHIRQQVAAVVNEFGETIGILTLDDILDTVFSPSASRSERLLRRIPIRNVSPGVWHVTGMTSLRRLTRVFGVPRPPSRAVTVAGVIQETLQRLPQVGDECTWGKFHFKVLATPQRGRLLVELTMVRPPEEGQT